MKVNGESIKLEKEMSVKSFLDSHGYNPTRIAVEVNGELVSKKSFEVVTLHDEDSVEIVSFVGGG